MNLKELKSELNYTFLNYETKRAKRYLTMYNLSTKEDIFQAYGKPSDSKVTSFRNIKATMKDVSGYDMRIAAAGSDYYSCAYKVKVDEGEYLVYETYANRYLIPYSSNKEINIGLDRKTYI